MISAKHRLSLVLAASAPLACSDPADPGDATDGPTSAGSTASGDPASTTSASTTTASDTTAAATDAPTTSGADATGDSATTGDDTGSDDTTSTTSTTDTTGDDTTGPSQWDGEPLPPAVPGAWTWIDFPESRCRNGTTTGIGVRYGSSDKLAIFFEGGGACFNTATCLLNDGFSNFGSFQFGAWKLGLGLAGIFDHEHADNPLADWNFVYVPYCTGDVHAGAKIDGGVPGVFGAQQFVGYRNVAHYLERLVPTFADASHVLVTGQSAGGFGAAFNFDRIADAWPAAQVTLLDDAGPPFADDYLAPCLQQEWRDLWNLDDTIPIDCDDCFGPGGGGISNLALYLADKHPGQHLALISSLQDTVIRTFFGYGMNLCKGGIMSGDTFEAGLMDLRDQVLGDHPAWGSFLVPGSNHTLIAGPAFFTTTVQGTRIVDWLADLLAGQTTHIQP
jgi:hypothetical protein